MQENERSKAFDRVEDSTSELVFDLIALLEEFMEEFFSDEYEVLKFNINFIESNGFAYQTKVDYIRLNRFISSAYSTIEMNDTQVIDGLVSKFYKDIIFLNSFYKSFLEKTKDVPSVFKYHFLKSFGGLEGLHTRLSLKEEKRTGKKELLHNEEEKNCFEEYVKEMFSNEFTKECNECSDQLRTIINTKTYYFDKLLWNEAKKSSSIQDFFKKSKRTDGDVSEELSTKIFIKQYIQTVDFTHTKNIKWHQYLQNIITVMD